MDYWWSKLREMDKYIIDAFSIGTILGTIIGLIPVVAALLSIVWTLIRIYETKTVQKYLRDRRC